MTLAVRRAVTGAKRSFGTSIVYTLRCGHEATWPAHKSTPTMLPCRRCDMDDEDYRKGMANAQFDAVAIRAESGDY